MSDLVFKCVLWALMMLCAGFILVLFWGLSVMLSMARTDCSEYGWHEVVLMLPSLEIGCIKYTDQGKEQELYDVIRGNNGGIE